MFVSMEALVAVTPIWITLLNLTPPKNFRSPAVQEFETWWNLTSMTTYMRISAGEYVHATTVRCVS